MRNDSEMKRGGRGMRKHSPPGGVNGPKRDAASSATPRPDADEALLHPGEDDDEDGKAQNKGTRYITVDLLKKLSRCDDIALVKTLDLSSAAGSEQIIRYMENLDLCENLGMLDLRNNGIQRIQNLEKLQHLRELHLSNNKIEKIEGIGHLSSLQVLNLAFNHIKHLPLWMSKKLQSLQTLHLQSNKLSSLHEIAKLKALVNLTSLTLAGNPVSSLAHHQPFIIFHLRSLDMLNGRMISSEERERAYQRFHTEEVERLERELDLKAGEIAALKLEQTGALGDLERQEALNRSLKMESERQKTRHEHLTRQLHQKSELLKQKTMLLTRSCQKHYELEQELAFYKIDAKLQPLPFVPDPEVDVEELSAESPYIGKACHQRNVPPPSEKLKAQNQHPEDLTEPDHMSHRCRPAPQRATGEEERLKQLREEICEKEQQLHRASEELRQLEEKISQKRICEEEKERLRQEMQKRIEKVGELKKRMEETQRQIDRNRSDSDQCQENLNQLQNLLQGQDLGNPRHAQLKAQQSKKVRLLAIMSRKQQELESRLDQMISRVHKETQDIQDLEQQLTNGQIAANEALKRDLESIISGLQDYLEGVKEQARRALTDCTRLQEDKDALQHLLKEKEAQCQELVEVAESSRQREQLQSQELEDLGRENDELKQVHRKFRDHETELERKMQEKDSEARRMQEELDRLHHLSQADCERFKEEIGALQQQLDQAREKLLRPESVAKHLDELIRGIVTGRKPPSSLEDLGEAVSSKMKELEQEVNVVVSAALRDRDKAERRQERLGEEMRSLAERLASCQEKCQLTAAEMQDERVEMCRLREELDDADEHHNTLLRRLEETEIDRDRVQARLMEQDKQSREHVDSLNLELQDLCRSFSSADRAAAQQLKASLDKLHSLHSTVDQIHQETTENAEELHSAQSRASQAVQDLCEAVKEIQVLQEMLREQGTETGGVPGLRPQDLDKLNQTLRRQQAQTKRISEQLARYNQAKDVDVEELVEEMAALKETLLQQTRFLSRLGDSMTNTGSWFYVPNNPTASTLESQGTQDSGLGSVLPDERGGRGGERNPPLDGGYWIYSPSFHQRRDSQISRDGESATEEASGSRFTTPTDSYSPPDGSPHPQADVLGRPVGPHHKGVFSHLVIPLVPIATLQCNVPGHQDLERDLEKAERRLRENRAGKHRRQRDQMALRETTAGLQQEIRRLHRSVRDLQHHTKGLECSVSQVEEEQCMLGELKSVEMTLLKHRAELRHAEDKLNETQAKTRADVQRCADAQKHLEEIEETTRLKATQLGRVQRQLRSLQEDVLEMQERRMEKEHTLQEVETALARRHAQFQEVGSKLESASARLEAVEEDLRRSRDLQAKLLDSCRETENSLTERLSELNQLCSQVVLKQEALSHLEKKLELCHMEEAELKGSVEQQRRKLMEATKQQDHSVRRVQDLGVAVRSLALQERQLNSCLSEKKRRLEQLKQEQQRQEERMENVCTDITKYTAELSDVRESTKSGRVELSALQQQTDTAVRERGGLQEQCRNLEARRTHAQRCLEVTETKVSEAEAQLHTLHSELEKLKEAQERGRDTAVAHHLLEEELRRLKTQVTEALTVLDRTNQEVEAATSQRDELVDQLRRLQADLRKKEEKNACRRQKLDRLRRQHTELQAHVKRKALQLEEHEEKLQVVERALLTRLETMEKEAVGSQQHEWDDKPEQGVAQDGPRFPAVGEDALLLHRRHKSEVSEVRGEGSSSEPEVWPSTRRPPRSPAYNTQDAQWRGEALRERLRQQEDYLKVQLRIRMSCQEEALCVRRLQTEGSVEGLRRRVDQLDQLLNGSAHSSPKSKNTSADYINLSD